MSRYLDDDIAQQQTWFHIPTGQFDGWYSQQGQDLLDASAGFAIMSHHHTVAPQATWPSTVWSAWAVRQDTSAPDGVGVSVSLMGQFEQAPQEFLSGACIGDLDDSYVAVILAGQDWVDGAEMVSTHLGGDVRLVVHGALIATRGGVACTVRDNAWVGDDPNADPCVRLDAVPMTVGSPQAVGGYVMGSWARGPVAASLQALLHAPAR